MTTTTMTTRPVLSPWPSPSFKTPSESELLAYISSLVDLAPKHSPSCADNVATLSVPLHGIFFTSDGDISSYPLQIIVAIIMITGGSVRRKRNVLMANVYFDGYLRMCTDMGLVDGDEAERLC